MEVQLLYNRVFVDPDKEETSKVIAGKLVTNIYERYIRGTVTHVGIGVCKGDSNEIEAIPVQVGDRVIYEQTAYNSITIDDKELHMVSVPNLIAIIFDNIYDKTLSEETSEIAKRISEAKQDVLNEKYYIKS